MKQITRTALMFFTFLAIACEQPYMKRAPDHVGNKGRVTLRLLGNEQRSANILFPGAGSDIIYSVTFSSADNGDRSFPDIIAEGNTGFELEPGAWNIAVKGFYYSEAQDASIQVAYGGASVTIAAGETANAAIKLERYIPGASDRDQFPDSDGKLAYHIILPDTNLESAFLRVYPIPSTSDNVVQSISLSAAAGGINGALSLNRGYYRVLVYVAQAGSPKKFAGKNEIVYIDRLQETVFSCAINESDFKSVPTITGNTSAAAIAALGTYLSGLPQNTVDTPYTVALGSVVNLSDFAGATSPLEKLYTNLKGRYAAIDLSACAGDLEADGTAPVADNDKLVSIILPSTVTTIGVAAFYQCVNLATVDLLAAALTAINDFAFFGCTTLSGLDLPSSLNSVGQGAFSGCPFANMDFSATGITSLPASLFYGCSFLKSVDLTGIDLTAIGNGVFTNCSSLERLDFSSTTDLNTFGNNIFSGCASLEEIIMPASSTVAQIPGSTFLNLESLKSIDLTPFSALTTIGTIAFSNCKELGEIKLPATAYAFTFYTPSNFLCTPFKGCAKAYFTIDDEANALLKAIEGGTVLLLRADTATTVYDTIALSVYRGADLAIPAGVTAIAQGAFSWSEIGGLTMPKGLATVNNYAFVGCSSLVFVRYNEADTGAAALANLPMDMFYNCSALRNIEFLRDIGGGLTGIGQWTFSGCSSLTSEALGAIDFSGLTGANLQARAFQGCTSLATVDLSASTITALPNYVFSACSNLTGVILPDTLTTISGQAFENCGNLGLVVLPDVSTLDITYSAFAGAKNVRFELADTNTQYKLYGDGTILVGAISANPVLLFSTYEGDLVLTDDMNIKVIGYNAFKDSKLRSIKINSTVTTINTGAFLNCSELAAVDLSEATSLASIGSAMYDTAAVFGNCVKLSSIDFSSTLVTAAVQGYIFYGCSNLERVVFKNDTAIPPSTGSAAVNAPFAGAVKLKFYFTGGDSALEGDNWRVSADHTQLFFKGGANDGTLFAHPSVYGGLVLPDNAKIAARAYQGAPITSLIVVAGVSSIGTYAFNNCELLEALVWRSPVKPPMGIFTGCGSLQSVDFCAAINDLNVTSLFLNVGSLTKVILRNEDGVVTFNTSATSLGTFGSVPKNQIELYVPDSLYKDYKNSAAWNLVTNKIKPISAL